MGRYLYLSIFLTAFVSTFASVYTSTLPSKNHKIHSIENEMNVNLLPKADIPRPDYKELSNVKIDGHHFTQSKKNFNSQGIGNKILPKNTGFIKAMPWTENGTNVTVVLRDTAQLKCQVGEEMWSSMQIFWTRENKYIIYGKQVAVDDWRISANYSAEFRERILQIKRAEKKDSGWYTCTVINDKEPYNLIEQMIYLDVIDPEVEASITGSPEIFIEDGGSLNLTCSVQSTSDSPSHMVWYHDGKWINYNTSNRNIQYQSGFTIMSSLISIPVASMESSGNYTCSPSKAHSASVVVQILQDYHDSGSFLEYLANAVCYFTSLLCE